MGMRRSFVILAGTLALASSAFAHDPGLSSATVTLGQTEMTALVVFNSRDLAALPQKSGLDYTSIASDLLRVRVGGQAIPARLEGVTRDQQQNISFRLHFAQPGEGRFEIASGIIDQLPFGHRQFLTVLNSAGQTTGSRLLSARDNQFETEIASVPVVVAPVSGGGFLDFLLLGVRHILTGYDHLLFLFGLLIVSRNVRSAALLITCFTIAHSLTLALSTFNVITLQSRIVEPAIAASIVYVGLENLYRGKTLDYRWILTFLFGLVHGLGFASVLREMGIANTGVKAAIPLIAFNSGVELGQLSIAMIVLPLIWKLRRHITVFRVAVPACSVIIALAGGYWFFERIFQS
jgi:hydrogenase/urease accessory protein HupE